MMGVIRLMLTSAEWIQRRARCLTLVFIGFCLGLSTPAALAQTEPLPLSTPPGVMLVEVVREVGYYGITYLWTRLGDDQGRTLYTTEADTESGISHCADQCAEDFVPFLAGADAKPMGDWDLFTRSNGSQQWVYQGRPLYRFSRETRVNEVVDNIIEEQFRDVPPAPFGFDLHKDRERVLTPKGWHVARFQPSADLQLPTSMAIGHVANGAYYGLLSHDGKTLYTRNNMDGQSNCDARCQQQWQPLGAGEFSHAAAPFTPVTGVDGDRQWAYRQQPLYTFAGDELPGDAHGITMQGEGGQVDGANGWRLAALQKHFMPANTGFVRDPVMGTILATAQGLPLYSRVSEEGMGFISYQKMRYSYRKGKELGARGCKAKCLEEWQPLLADAQSRSRGFWEVVEIPGGQRQWAYKGFLQYTFAGDAPYQAASGNGVLDYVMGEGGDYALEDVVLYAQEINAYNFNWRRSVILRWIPTMP